jgi:hypothetical protein
VRLLQRLPGAFDSATAEQVQAYIGALREVWRDVSAAISRNSWFVVLLIAAYELAGRGIISKLNAGPVVIEHLKYLRVFVPTIVSYILYEQILLIQRWVESEAVHRYLMRQLVPKVEEEGFDSLLAPRLPALSNLVQSHSSLAETRSRNIRGLAQYGLALFMLSLVPLFDFVALTELWSQIGRSAVYWINVALTAGLVTLAMVVLVLWLIEERLIW